MKNQKIVLASILIMIVVFVGFVSFYNQNQQSKLTTLSKEQKNLFKRDYSFTIGPNNAKVQLVEFFDPACETCALFHPYIKRILKANKNDIQLVLRYAPFHNGSDKVVTILEASRNQDMYLETLELLFKIQANWASHHKEPNFNIIFDEISKLGIDMDLLLKDMKSEDIKRKINQDIEDGKILGANKTPSYYVNGRPLQQFGLNQLKELIYEELNK